MNVKQTASWARRKSRMRRVAGATSLTLFTGCSASHAPVDPAAAYPLSSWSVDTADVDPRLMLAVADFHAQWQTAWQVSESTRLLRNGGNHRRSPWHVTPCHDYVWVGREGSFSQGAHPFLPSPTRIYGMVLSSNPALGICPTWQFSGHTDALDDESDWRDAALLPNQRPAIARARATLIALLSANYHEAPRASPWLSGQLVRQFIDARDFDGAASVVEGCTRRELWCERLAALVHARRGNTAAADSIFRRAQDDRDNCTSNSLRQLLPRDDQSAYDKTACSTRDSLHRQLWWLADPLWRRAGNARLVEHERRRIEIEVRKATIQDERYSFDFERGGEAVAETILRFGWPSYAGWVGPVRDREFRSYLVLNVRSPDVSPSTTFEYALGRIQSIPSWRAITNPFEARASDWFLAKEDADGNLLDTWWPQEHFKPDRRLVQLPDGQTISIRRHAHVEVATALALAHPIMRHDPGQFDVMLLATTGPTRIDSVAQVVARGGATAVLRGVVSHSPTLLGIEALGLGTTELDARTRFAYAPPPPLAALAPDSIALSDIALLHPLSQPQLRAPNDSLLRYLRPHLRLSGADRRIALYWENYGITPEDSATVTVRVATDIDLGILRRMGMAAGLPIDPNSYLQIRFTDRDAQGGTTTLRGPVPVQMRTLALDLSSLKPGRYTVEVGMTLKDSRTASRQTAIELFP